MDSSNSMNEEKSNRNEIYIKKNTKRKMVKPYLTF